MHTTTVMLSQLILLQIRRACCALLAYAAAAECGAAEVIGTAIALQEACHLCAGETRLGHQAPQQLKLRCVTLCTAV
jgi:hypothetical protein